MCVNLCMSQQKNLLVGLRINIKNNERIIFPWENMKATEKVRDIYYKLRSYKNVYHITSLDLFCLNEESSCL